MIRFPVCSLVLALVLLRSAAVRAGDTPPHRPFFLPQSPRAAAYILGRLSNRELIGAPRSEFVYVALLERNGLPRRYRLEALSGLTAIRHTDALTELISGLDDLDRKGEESMPALGDLGALLLRRQGGELVRHEAALEKLALRAQLPLTRQLGYAAWVTAEGGIAPVWARVAGEPGRLADLLLAIPRLGDPAWSVRWYGRIEPLTRRAVSPAVQRAAITALAAIPVRNTDTFNRLADLVRAGTERATAIAALQRLPRQAWAKAKVSALLRSLLDYLPTVPPADRTGADFSNALRFATDLASLLPGDRAGSVARTLRGLGPTVIILRTVYEQMLFDQSLLVAPAGKPVEIILENKDAMPHNLVIVRPGALEEIGTLAEQSGPDPDAFGRQYIPPSPKVLYATKLLSPGQEAKLAFTAPVSPGDYPYLCTFPGHWRRMHGLLAVVADVDAYRAAHAGEFQPKLKEWKLADLAAGLGAVGPGRNLVEGRALFTRLGCVQCHRIGGEGNRYGPDLTAVFQRWTNDPASVVTQILDPSKVIAARYRNYEFQLTDGDSVSGMILKETADTLTIQTGPSDKLIQTLKKADIKSRRAGLVSVMPRGLLSALSKDQILDLLAFLKSGGGCRRLGPATSDQR